MPTPSTSHQSQFKRSCARGKAAACRTKRVRGANAATTPDRVYDADELEFLTAIRKYQEATGVRFPTWTEALTLLKGLGYRKP